MSTDLERWYREALADLNVERVARETGRAPRTLHSYLSGERRITEAAVSELVAYLKARSEHLDASAERLSAAFEMEGKDG